MLHINFDNVYVKSSATTAGKKEACGPLKDLFDKVFIDKISRKQSFESFELMLKEEAIDICLNKCGMSYDDINLFIAGDLNNQIACSSKTSGKLDSSFIGIYGACSTSALGILTGASFIKGNIINEVLVSSTSSYATSERQFRNPIEYGGGKRYQTTFTVTGSGAILLSNKFNKIRVKRGSIGKTYDTNWTDVNDLGTGMSYAAYKTIKEHLKYFNLSPDYYDAIITGDLSTLGSKVLLELFKNDGIDLNNHLDAGTLIFDVKKQDVFMGGSGAACAPLVTYSMVFNKLKLGEYKRVLLVATGALFDPHYL